ncbi:MAG: cytochrome c [Gallionellaceae bacterium]|nr:cytochrome c [Gallionellaceae bacterium]
MNRYLGMVWVMASLAAMANPAVASETDRLLGQHLYRDGVLPSGQPLAGMAQTGVVRFGKDAACTACHRRSGFGTAEGSIVIRPIAGPDLYQTREVNAATPRIAHQLGKPLRPAYDDTTLARAIREGIDVTGRQMGNGMPAYPLGDAEMNALLTYLKTLSAETPPGVNDTEIHLATVIQPNVAPELRRAVIGVLDEFVRDKNAGVRSEEVRRKVGTMRVYRAYRKWVLHIWQLDGPPERWQAQMELRYRQQPVFALVGGLGTTSWQPIHAFSERFQVPCILPLTDLPATTGSNDYTVYFSRGIGLEAEALAQYLGQQHDAEAIIQVYRPGSIGAVAAERLRTALAGSGRHLEDRPLIGTAGPEFWHDLAGVGAGARVLWLDAADLAGAAGTQAVYLSSTLLGGLTAVPDLEGALLTYPWEVPALREPRVQRSKQWLHRHGLASPDVAVQAAEVNTLFAITTAGDALAHLQDSFSRDYFIERVEHNVTTTLMPSFYPSVSLGPDQRYASKGVYIVRSDAALDPVSSLIVP